MMRLLILFFIFSTTVFANPSDEFEAARFSILEYRENNSVQKIADRLGISYQSVVASTERVVKNKTILRFGHVRGNLGICEINLKFSLVDSQKYVRCINGRNVTTFYP